MADKPELSLRGLDEFVSDDYVTPFVVTIGGLPGMGKSTLALSMSARSNVYFIETEHRFSYLVKKLHPTLVNPERIKQVTANNWQEIKSAAQLIMMDARANPKDNRGVVVIDSGTDFKNFADTAWKEDPGQKTYPPVNWGVLYNMMNEIVKGLKAWGMSVIFTCRVKPAYDSNGNQTDGFKLDHYKNQADLSEAIIIINRDETFDVLKNSWHNMSLWDEDASKLTRDMTLPEIIDILQS